MKIAWDISKQCFTITDYYYFSKLQKFLKENGFSFEETTDFNNLDKYDIIVFNYPEKFFSEEESLFLKDLVNSGKRILCLAYYKNEDFIADTCNSLAKVFNVKFHGDEITDPKNNYENDPYFVVTPEKYMLACTCSLEGGEIFVRASFTAISNQGYQPILAVKVSVGNGCFIGVGSCVFWDNYSIDVLNNKDLILKLLRG